MQWYLSDFTLGNGMTLSDAIINYNSQPSVAKKAPILVHQHQNGFISPVTSLDHFRIQSNPQYQQNQMMTPQQFYPSQPRYQNLPDPNRGQMNYFVPPAQQQQYIGPRFMRDRKFRLNVFSAISWRFWPSKFLNLIISLSVIVVGLLAFSLATELSCLIALRWGL